ncbi:TPA: hemagglutinin repeat-containing protein [Providencia rettgeri]|uniref:hemagglutinin repeat-containing protein n=1 Tax=Providencia huaxiensis TaxID=2027290 RepID=UPI00293F9C10|nr:hemagglutinin repeat-containing protein [Providencia rettgeri]
MSSPKSTSKLNYQSFPHDLNNRAVGFYITISNNGNNAKLKLYFKFIADGNITLNAARDIDLQSANLQSKDKIIALSGRDLKLSSIVALLELELF